MTYKVKLRRTIMKSYPMLLEVEAGSEEEAIEKVKKMDIANGSIEVNEEFIRTEVRIQKERKEKKKQAPTMIKWYT